MVGLGVGVGKLADDAIGAAGWWCRAAEHPFPRKRGLAAGLARGLRGNSSGEIIRGPLSHADHSVSGSELSGCRRGAQDIWAERDAGLQGGRAACRFFGCGIGRSRGSDDLPVLVFGGGHGADASVEGHCSDGCRIRPVGPGGGGPAEHSNLQCAGLWHHGGGGPCDGACVVVAARDRVSSRSAASGATGRVVVDGKPIVAPVDRAGFWDCGVGSDRDGGVVAGEGVRVSGGIL